VYGSVSKVKKINDDRQLLPRYLTKDTERLHITYCTLYIVYSILPLAIAYSLWIMATVNCILHISYGIFHMAYFIWHISYGIFHMAYFIWHISYGIFHIASYHVCCTFQGILSCQNSLSTDQDWHG
jgi:hypothetical protein